MKEKVKKISARILSRNSRLHRGIAVEAPSAPIKLCVVAVCVALFIYADRLATWLQGWDGMFFWFVVVLFLGASRIGTKIVMKIAADGGELPANDEMFNLPDVSSAEAR